MLLCSQQVLRHVPAMIYGPHLAHSLPAPGTTSAHGRGAQGVSWGENGDGARWKDWGRFLRRPLMAVYPWLLLWAAGSLGRSSSEEKQLVKEVTEVREDILDKFPSARSQDNAQRVERSYSILAAGQGLGWHQTAASRPSLFLKCLEGTQGVATASSEPTQGVRPPAGARQESEPPPKEVMAKVGAVQAVGTLSRALLGAPAGQVSARKLLSHHVLLPVWETCV